MVGSGRVPIQSRAFLCRDHFPSWDLCLLSRAKETIPPAKGSDWVVGRARGVPSPFPELDAFQSIPRGLFDLSPIFCHTLELIHSFPFKKTLSSQADNKYHLSEIVSNHEDKHNGNNVIKF